MNYGYETGAIRKKKKKNYQPPRVSTFGETRSGDQRNVYKRKEQPFPVASSMTPAPARLIRFRSLDFNEAVFNSIQNDANNVFGFKLSLDVETVAFYCAEAKSHLVCNVF